MRRNKVAFIMHPLNVLEFRQKEFFYSPFERQVSWLLKKFSPNFVKHVFSNLPPHTFMEISGFESLDKKIVDIIGVMCPMFPEEVVFNKDRAFEKVKKSVQYAIKKNADVIVLAGFTSIIGNQGEDVKKYFSKKHKFVITSGNTLTSALCLNGIEKIVNFLNYDFKILTASVIGATGDIGGACAKILAKKCKKIVLSSRSLNSQNDLFVDIKENINSNVYIQNDIRLTAANSDIVVLATSSVFPLLEIKDLKKGSIVCDVSLPHNVSMGDSVQEFNAFVFDGGKARVPKLSNLYPEKWKKFTNNFNCLPGCLAEGLILALENILDDDFSLGRGNITVEKMDFIYSLAIKHGFDVANFAFHEKIYLNEELSFYKEKKSEKLG